MKSIFLTGFFILLISACTSDHVIPDTGKFIIHFNFLVNNGPAVYNKMVYANAAGNPYELTNIQYFISDLVLQKADGKKVLPADKDWIHYVDSDLPESTSWELPGILAGEYKGILFTFGIKGEKNVPGMFTDPPESNMLWPYGMGGDFGGYHYMKLNGFWKNASGQRVPFNFHFGVGQIYDSTGIVKGYVQNWFEVIVPSSAFTLKAGNTKEAWLEMNIESWFDTPHEYDHNVYGGAIMKNQEAMGKIRDNGSDVFTIRFSNDDR